MVAEEIGRFQKAVCLQGKETEEFGGLFDKDSDGNSAGTDSKIDGENSDDGHMDHQLSDIPPMDP